MTRKSWDYETAVIGAGPGGLVSAIYLRRFKRTVVLINHGKPRAAWIPETHNLIGFPHGISGNSLLLRLNRHVSTLGTDRILGEARIKRLKNGFEIEVGSDSLRAKKVILATGMDDIQPDIPN